MDYQKGKIYKIVSEFTDKIYIGSTCSPLSKRLYQHKKNYEQYKRGTFKGFTRSFDLIELGEVDIFLIEDYPCENKSQLHTRERYWIEQNLNLTTNKVIPTRTDKEYLKMYREKYAEKISIQAKLYKETHRAEIEKYQKEYMPKYLEINKSKIAVRTKQYRLKNLENIRAQTGRSYFCECGASYTHNHKERHFQTQKHQNYIKQSTIRISKEDFEFLFEMDSKMLLPKTYPNIFISQI